MNNKWIINKLAAVLVVIAVIFAIMRYYRVYDFNVSVGDRLLFWVPDAIVGVAGLVIFVITFKAKRE